MLESRRISCMPSASLGFESLAARFGQDLRTRFPAIEVRVRPSVDEVVLEVLDGGDAWGAVHLADDTDDEFSHPEIEAFIARVVTERERHRQPVAGRAH